MDDFFKPDELVITGIVPSPGGQHVGTYTGVKVVHVPTGITISVEVERSQHKNLQIAKDGIAGALTSPHLR